MRKSRHSGFTIVELLIVVVIIAVLATITVVAYNGLQARARASSATAALTQAKKKLELYKVDNGNYPLTGSLSAAGVTNPASATYQYASTTGTSYCLTAVSGSTSYFIDSSSQQNPAQGGCNGHAWPGGIAMTNLLTNGDFSSGTTGWILGSGWAITGGVLNGSTTDGAAYQAVGTGSVPTGSQIYLGMTIAAYSGGTIEAHLGGMGENMRVGSAVYYSVVQQATTVNGNIVIDGDGFIGTSDNVIAINLTATFGAGNEPTRAQMDAIMQQFPNRWFNGTVTANTAGILPY